MISIYHTLKWFGIINTVTVNAADSLKRNFTTALARLTQASSVRAVVAALDWLLWVASDQIANVLATRTRDGGRRGWAARARIVALNTVP